MKKLHLYYLADLFTLLEVILAVALFVMAIIGASAEWSLFAFVAGELCDAVDGPCARRWHYPKDGKYRWWRRYNSEIDQISDIMLGIACGIYLVLRTNWIIGVSIFGGVGIFCLIVQAYLYCYDSKNRFSLRYNYEHSEKLILFRRRIYVIAGVGGSIALLLWHTTWALAIKLVLSVAGIIIGIVIFMLKRNRWSENKTKL